MAKEGAGGIPKLLPYAQDPDAEVRREVVRSMVAIGGPASLEPLTQALSDSDEEVQIRATDGVVNFYLPGYWESGLSGTMKRAGTRVLSRWTDTNDQVIPGYVEVRPEVVAALGKMTNSSESMVARANAARAVGVLRGKAALGDLVQAMTAKDGKLIYEVLIAFEKIRDRGVAPKIHYLLRDLDEKVQLAALETVGLLMNPESVAPLREAYERARNERVRRAALNAVALIPDEGSRPLFMAQLDSPDEYLRAAAAEGLARLGKAEDEVALRERFDKEVKMRARLAQAFGAARLGAAGMGEFDALRYLVNTLNQKAWKGMAEGYLVELVRVEAVRAALMPVVAQSTKTEKLALAQVFGRSGSRDLEPALEGLAKDADTEVASEALRNLRSLRTLAP
ncbi:MAG: HEAT repeat domain-containing protein [Acidobacteria bacterium]|nr:HEAT repeat domain-containing protein [Acidobacteriota bacterium]